MAIAIKTIIQSIEAMNVAGIRILSKTLDKVTAADCPLIMPSADFVTNFRIELADITRQEIDIYYTLNYRFFATSAGSGHIFDAYDKMVSGIARFLDAALLKHDLEGVQNIEPVDVISFGVVESPDGAMFWGCDIALEILEFMT